ncbi:MAG: DUF4097 family beta strand repeat protein [Actinobacteria bacterium]|nr:DUF4097 family beta strand repeat protein [Actinomycetota bacterium]
MEKKRALLIIAAIVLSVFVVGAVLVVFLSRTASETYALPADITSLTVDSERGSVTISADPGAPGIDATSRWILSAPTVEIQVDGGHATVGVSCPGWAFASCSADLEVRVPAGVELDAKTVRGALEVVGVQGPIDAISEDGTVRVEGGPSRLTARSVTGDVQARLTAAPSTLNLRSETGDVTAEIPAGTYALDVTSTEGTATVTGLTDQEGAAHTVSASSGIGNVVVRAAPR